MRKLPLVTLIALVALIAAACLAYKTVGKMPAKAQSDSAIELDGAAMQSLNPHHHASIELPRIDSDAMRRPAPDEKLTLQPYRFK